MFLKLLYLGEFTVLGLLVILSRKYCKKTIGRLPVIGVTCLFILALLLCNSAVHRMPIVYDEVKVTALNQKGGASKGVEVSITGVTVGTQEYGVPKVCEGKWFFTTESRYMWRPETDVRQPDGTTQSITLLVPVGKDRTMHFIRSDWGGKAIVDFAAYPQEVDTNLSDTFSLLDSGRRMQLLQMVCRLSIFTLMMCFFGYFLHQFVDVFTAKDKEKIRSKMIYGGIAAVSLIFVVSFSRGQQLWLDEMFQIGFSGTGKTLYETLMVPETTPPLFRLIANVWYNIVPYGEEWLLLLPAVFCACFVYTAGLLGEETGGKYMGYTASLLAATSIAALEKGAREFRSNALLLLLSCLFLLYYLKRLKTGKYKGVYLLLMLLLAHTHYFGVFLCGAAFLIDSYDCISGKRQWKSQGVYLAAVLLYIPWMIRFLQLGHLSAEAFWQPIPSFIKVYQLLLFLCGSEGMIILFALGACLAVMEKAEHAKLPRTPAQFLLGMAGLMILCLYIYGTFVRPEASLWDNRYFLNILPCIIITEAYALCYIGHGMLSLWNNSMAEKTRLRETICIVLAISLFLGYYPTLSKTYQAGGYPYKAAAEYIYAQPDAYKDDTLVVMLNQDYVVDGWYEYYMIMQGKRDPIDCVSTAKIPSGDMEAEEFFADYNTVYFCYLQQGNSPQFTKQLDAHYEETADNTNVKVKVYKRLG